MNINNVNRFSDCSNCGACYNVCPVNAIRVDTNDLFYSVKADDDICIKCGKCISVCPVNNPNEIKQNVLSAYGGWINDNDILEKSSSGGAFSAISEIILKNNGLVISSIYSKDNYSVVFGGTDTYDIDRLRRSKYVESNVGMVFRDIKQQLISGRQVLFCGTPCQVTGLKRYLNGDPDNLITCDFSCGGLSSHQMFEKHIKLLEKRYKSKVDSINFRSGLFGWKRPSILVKFKNGRRYIELGSQDPYMFGFEYSCTTIREYCYSCGFSDNHSSDITLADFWEWSRMSTLKNKETGISLILANTSKGEKICEAIKERMTLEKLNVGLASYNIHKTERLDERMKTKRDAFLKCYMEEGLENAARQYGMRYGISSKVAKVKALLYYRLKKDRG